MGYLWDIQHPGPTQVAALDCHWHFHFCHTAHVRPTRSVAMANARARLWSRATTITGREEGSASGGWLANKVEYDGYLDAEP